MFSARPMEECGRALHDAHLNDGETVVKMGHPALVSRSLVVAEGGVGVYFGGGMGWDQAGDEGYAD
jgi:hypothetical protein